MYQGIEDVKVIATIISERKETSYKVSYTVKVESINGNKKYKGTNLIVYLPKNQNLEYGDKIVIDGTYEKAKQASNYKAFDYREYLKTKNVYGILNAEKVSVLKKNNLNSFMIIINSIRMKIKENLKEILGEEAKTAIRNSSSEIVLIYQKKL